MARLAGAAKPNGVVLSSVVPAVNRLWKEIAHKLWRGVPWVNVNHRCKLDVPITYPKPETIGADRLANACEAAHRYGAPVIVATSEQRSHSISSAGRKDTSWDYRAGTVAHVQLSLGENGPSSARQAGSGAALRREKHGGGDAARRGLGYRGLVREILKELTSRIGEEGVKALRNGWVCRVGSPRFRHPDAGRSRSHLARPGPDI